MGIAAQHLRYYIIRPTLQIIGLWSQTAENLLMGTAAQESQMGTYLKQVKGVAVGIYQMEPATHKDLLYRELEKPSRATLKTKVLGLVAAGNSKMLDYETIEANLVFNLAYATAMARVKYLTIDEPIPTRADDLDDFASYWKRYYNTPMGKGTVEEYKANYAKYVTG